MAKRTLKWNLSESNIKVQFVDSDVKETFSFGEILGYDNLPMFTGITFELFRHGLKQKLADSVAGMGKKGYNATEQLEIMASVWESICKGEFSSRKSAVKKLTKADAIAAVGENATPEALAIVEKLFANM